MPRTTSPASPVAVRQTVRLLLLGHGWQNRPVMSREQCDLVRSCHARTSSFTRTLSGASSEWRYVPVRRLASFIEESIQKGTQWAVFEPNGQTLWASIERNVDAFLNTYWREGALAGTRPEAAYFVKCNSETMTQSDIEAGIINIQIGIAPLKPAEFIIIRIRLTSNQT